jgi:hypothetical protein
MDIRIETIITGAGTIKVETKDSLNTYRDCRFYVLANEMLVIKARHNESDETMHILRSDSWEKLHTVARC